MWGTCQAWCKWILKRFILLSYCTPFWNTANSPLLAFTNTSPLFSFPYPSVFLPPPLLYLFLSVWLQIGQKKEEGKEVRQQNHQLNTLLKAKQKPIYFFWIIPFPLYGGPFTKALYGIVMRGIPRCTLNYDILFNSFYRNILKMQDEVIPSRIKLKPP